MRKIKKNILLIFVFCIPFISSAQEKEKKLNTKFYGFVRNDVFWDTRQTFAPREGHCLLWPEPVRKDQNGKDINGRGAFNFLSIQTRFGVNLTGPLVLNAKTFAKIEGDFFSQANDNINQLRLRHAYLKLNWKDSELLFGQNWIPMFISGCFPGTISFNTGMPLQPFGFNPQIRFTQKINNISLIGILSAQRDFANRGPNPNGTGQIASGRFLRNSGVPSTDIQIHYNSSNKETGTDVFAGIGAGYRRIIPRLETTAGFKTDEGVSSFSTIGFFKIKLPKVTFKAEGIYGQNMDYALLIGGFATKEIINPLTGVVAYTPSNTLSVWTDIHTNGKTQFGIFAGYTENKGFSDKIISGESIYGLGNDIASLYRVSPRVIFKLNHINFALEGEYTSADFGNGSFSEKGIPQNTTTADNFRILFAATYIF